MLKTASTLTAAALAMMMSLSAAQAGDMKGEMKKDAMMDKKETMMDKKETMMKKDAMMDKKTEMMDKKDNMMDKKTEKKEKMDGY